MLENSIAGQPTRVKHAYAIGCMIGLKLWADHIQLYVCKLSSVKTR